MSEKKENTMEGLEHPTLKREESVHHKNEGFLQWVIKCYPKMPISLVRFMGEVLEEGDSDVPTPHDLPNWFTQEHIDTLVDLYLAYSIKTH